MSQQSSSFYQQQKELTEFYPESPRAEQSTTPQTRPETSGYFAAAARSSPPYVSPYARVTETEAEQSTIPVLRSQGTPGPSTSLNPELRELPLTDYPVQPSMSTYSSSSASSSIYDSPNPQKYRGTIGMMNNSKQISTVSIRSSTLQPRR